MILTEENAKTKWCPMVRVFKNECEKTYTTNEDFNNGFEKTCIASDCMMWRWNKVYAGLSHGGKQTNYSNDGGYCGLAGKP